MDFGFIAVVAFITAFVLMIGVLGYKTLKYRSAMKDITLERIEFAEKDVDDQARFFVCAVYQSGRVEMIAKQPLTEEQAIHKSSEFVDKYKPNKPKFW